MQEGVWLRLEGERENVLKILGFWEIFREKVR